MTKTQTLQLKFSSTDWIHTGSLWINEIARANCRLQQVGPWRSYHICAPDQDVAIATDGLDHSIVPTTSMLYISVVFYFC
jgi:hypothetical protein